MGSKLLQEVDMGIILLSMCPSSCFYTSSVSLTKSPILVLFQLTEIKDYFFLIESIINQLKDVSWECVNNVFCIVYTAPC